MIKLKYASALIAFWISTHAHAEAMISATPGGPQFCMQTYNAYGPLYAPETKNRMDWIGSLLQGIPRCSVIQLQEVWAKSNIDQIVSSMSSKYTISAPNRDQTIGVMSLFDAPIKSTVTQTFKVNNEGGVLDTIRSKMNVKKAFHVVRTQLFGMDEDLYFINTHLHPTNQAVRLTQIIDILEWRLQNQNLKFLMSGDFNADEKSFERDFMMTLLGMHDSLLETFNGQYPKGYCTYCSSNPHSWLLNSHILDYIFVSNIGGGETHLKPLYGEINMRGPLREPLSDHYGVKVQFEMEQGKTAISAQQLQERKALMLNLLDQATQILGTEKIDGLAAYAEKARALREQVQSGQGDFARYLEKFN